MSSHSWESSRNCLFNFLQNFDCFATNAFADETALQESAHLLKISQAKWSAAQKAYLMLGLQHRLKAQIGNQNITCKWTVVSGDLVTRTWNCCIRDEFLQSKERSFPFLRFFVIFSVFLCESTSTLWKTWHRQCVHFKFGRHLEIWVGLQSSMIRSQGTPNDPRYFETPRNLPGSDPGGGRGIHSRITLTSRTGCAGPECHGGRPDARVCRAHFGW